MGRLERYYPSIMRAENNEAYHAGYQPLIGEYIHLLLAKLDFHKHHTEFNGQSK